MLPRGSDQKHPNLRQSFYFSFQGLKSAFLRERNFKIMLFISIIAIVIGCVLRIDVLSWVVIITMIALVLFGELMNTALEAIVDLASPDYHDLAKYAKDVAAGAVLLLSIAALIIGLIVFGSAFVGGLV